MLYDAECEQYDIPYKASHELTSPPTVCSLYRRTIIIIILPQIYMDLHAPLTPRTAYPIYPIGLYLIIGQDFKYILKTLNKTYGADTKLLIETVQGIRQTYYGVAV